MRRYGVLVLPHECALRCRCTVVALRGRCGDTDGGGDNPLRARVSGVERIACVAVGRAGCVHSAHVWLCVLRACSQEARSEYARRWCAPVVANNRARLLPKLAATNLNTGGPLLANWDQRLEADSPAAALWNVWYYRHLNPVLGSLLTKGEPPPSGSLSTQTSLELLETDEGQKLAETSLRQAWAATTELLGTDASQWQWGDLHQMVFAHPLLNRADVKIAEDMKIRTYPRGGSANTTNNTGFYDNTFNVRSGASFRMVVDVGNWDDARMTNAPGQSGDPRSPFYDNLLENWATEGHVPMLFSREKIEESAVLTISLTPKK